jgi:hypothetical protein
VELASNIAEILSRAQSSDIRRCDPAYFVWHLRYPAMLARDRRNRCHLVDQCRRAILDAFLQSDEPIFITHHEPPEEYAMGGDWAEVAERTWRWPPDLDPSQCQGWLQLGGWSLYASHQSPPVGSPHLSGNRPDEIFNAISESSISVLVDSFWDDLEWTVAVAKLPAV